MHKSNPPQTTSKSNVRDAAVQIGMKARAICRGTSLEDQDAVLRLAGIVASLTSADREERERAKRTVRELVKLGKGE